MATPDTLIAVTGATGFIGRVLCGQLLAAGYAVKALVRTPRAAADLQRAGVEIIPGDLATPESLQQLVDCVAAVIHCAATVRGNSPEAFDAINLDGTRALADAAVAQAQPPRFLQISSLAAREPGLCWYGTSKLRGEQLLADYAGQMELTVLRPPAVYGPGDREMRPVFSMMKRGIAMVPGSPEARISLLHVDDLVAAILACLQQRSLPQGPYTPTDPCLRGYDWREMAQIAASVFGRPVRLLRLPRLALDSFAACNLGLSRVLGYAPMLTPSKLKELRHENWVGDPTDLMSATGWKPRIGLEQGLLELVETAL